MKLRQPVWLLVLLMTTTSHVWAYGSSSSSKKACDKPSFTEFSPVNNALVAANSAFSFLASPNTHPESIEVTIKGRVVPVTVTPKNQSFQVSGVLPEDLKNDFARISITANGANQCKGSGGWLVKITE